jgi:hypothetical protein
MTEENRPGLLVVHIDIPPEYETEMARWYDEAHLPERRPGPGSARGVKPHPGFRTARRFVSANGERRFMALYELDAPGAALSPAYMTQQAPDPVGARLQAVWDLVVRNVYAEVTDPVPAPPSEPRGHVVLLAMAEVASACTGEYTAWFAAQRRDRIRYFGVGAVRRFEIVSGTPHHLVLYEAETLADLPAPEGLAGTLAGWRPDEAPPPAVRAFREAEPEGPNGW